MATSILQGPETRSRTRMRKIMKRITKPRHPHRFYSDEELWFIGNCMPDLDLLPEFVPNPAQTKGLYPPLISYGWLIDRESWWEKVQDQVPEKDEYNSGGPQYLYHFQNFVFNGLESLGIRASRLDPVLLVIGPDSAEPPPRMFSYMFRLYDNYHLEGKPSDELIEKMRKLFGFDNCESKWYMAYGSETWKYEPYRE